MKITGRTGDNFPFSGSIAVDRADNVYVGRGSINVLKITPAGIITEIIDVPTNTGLGRLELTRAIAVDSADNIYVVGRNNVFKVTLAESRETEPRKQGIDLRTGWNLISVDRSLVNNLVADIFAGINIGKIWTWEKNRFVSADRLEPFKGYWVFVGQQSDNTTLIIRRE